jgi:hypothetical protein
VAFLRVSEASRHSVGLFGLILMMFWKSTNQSLHCPHSTHRYLEIWCYTPKYPFYHLWKLQRTLGMPWPTTLLLLVTLLAAVSKPPIRNSGVSDSVDLVTSAMLWLFDVFTDQLEVMEGINPTMRPLGSTSGWETLFEDANHSTTIKESKSE